MNTYICFVSKVIFTSSVSWKDQEVATTEWHPDCDFSKYLSPIKRAVKAAGGNIDNWLKHLIVPKNKEAMEKKKKKKVTSKENRGSGNRWDTVGTIQKVFPRKLLNIQVIVLYRYFRSTKQKGNSRY